MNFHALLVFLACLGVYHLNGDFLPGNDATPNVYLPVSILNEGNPTFTPREVPFMFDWKLETERGEVLVPVRRWDEDPRIEQLYENGTLTVARAPYYLVPTKRTGEYVGQYGPGAGLCALPVFAALHAAGGNLADHPRTLWYAAKFVASVFAAGSAVCVFLIALRFVGRRPALVITLAYALGTNVWSVSSQTLWQHAPNEFFLALGVWYLVRVGEGRRMAAYCALSLAAAVVCRPTSAVVVAVVGAYLLIAHRTRLVPFALAGLPIGLALAAYNAFYLGSPIDFGQAERGKAIAEYKTGSPEVWRWSALPGNAAGHLASPSRGLLLFSPFLVFSMWGAGRAWRDRSYAVLRPLTVAIVLVLLITFVWFDWWGGWSFGPRLLVDTMPFFCLLLIPVIGSILERRARRALFLVMVGWSVFVQVLGAFAYDLQGWNALRAYEVRLPGEPKPRIVADVDQARQLAAQRGGSVVREIHRDIDQPQHHHRLWSLVDNEIMYYATHFGESRRAKHALMDSWSR